MYDDIAAQQGLLCSRASFCAENDPILSAPLSFPRPKAYLRSELSFFMPLEALEKQEENFPQHNFHCPKKKKKTGCAMQANLHSALFNTHNKTHPLTRSGTAAIFIIGKLCHRTKIVPHENLTFYPLEDGLSLTLSSSCRRWLAFPSFQFPAPTTKCAFFSHCYHTTRPFGD